MYDSKNITVLQLRMFATVKSACNITIFFLLRVELSFVFTDKTFFEISGSSYIGSENMFPWE